MGQKRQRKPIEEQESARWLEGYPLACELQRSCPETLVVHVSDREGDMHEWFLEAMRRVPGERAACIIRAQCDRRLAKGTAPRYVWEVMQQARAAGRIPVELARQPERLPRPVTLSVAVKRVTFQGARWPGGRLPPVEVVAVSVKESRPPDGGEPMAWRLLTSRPVTEFPSAWTGVPWYRCRWAIDRFFRVLKQGCQIER